MIRPGAYLRSQLLYKTIDEFVLEDTKLGPNRYRQRGLLHLFWFNLDCGASLYQPLQKPDALLFDTVSRFT